MAEMNAAPRILTRHDLPLPDVAPEAPAPRPSPYGCTVLTTSTRCGWGVMLARWATGASGCC